MDFQQVWERYLAFQDQLARGPVSPEELRTMQSQLVCRDDQGMRWTVDVRSGRWYMVHKNQWVPRDPPVKLVTPSRAAAPPPPPGWDGGLPPSRATPSPATARPPILSSASVSPPAASLVPGDPFSSRVSHLEDPKMASIGFFRPFAGRGQRAGHGDWLMDGLGHKAEDLRQVVLERFRQRQNRAEVQPRVLRERGLGIETRDYLLIERGLVTTAVYIARFGQDLYISWNSFILGHISKVRAIVFGICVILMTLWYLEMFLILVGIPTFLIGMAPAMLSPSPYRLR